MEKSVLYARHIFVIRLFPWNFLLQFVLFSYFFNFHEKETISSIRAAR